MAARRGAGSHRTDRLSAAYRNLQRTDDEAAAYAAFCQHYGDGADPQQCGRVA